MCLFANKNKYLQITTLLFLYYLTIINDSINKFNKVFYLFRNKTANYYLTL